MELWRLCQASLINSRKNKLRNLLDRTGFGGNCLLPKFISWINNSGANNELDVSNCGAGQPSMTGGRAISLLGRWWCPYRGMILLSQVNNLFDMERRSALLEFSFHLK